jgi:MFS family permease
MDTNSGKVMLLVVVLAIASLVFGAGAVSPALADIAKAFPDKSPETIQMVVTIPSLMIMVSTLICGQLSRVMRKKTLVLAGMVMFAVGGVLPAFFGDLTFLLVMRGVFGAGCGFLIPISQALIADYFQGRDREVFMGYRSSTAGIFGMFYTMAGGYLCAIHWRNTFHAYWIVVPVFLLILLMMPEPEGRKAAEKGEKAAGLTSSMWFYVTMYFLYNVTMMCFITNAAFVMAASNVGSARTIGFIMTISSVGGIAAGLLLGWLTRLLKNFTLVFALCCLAGGFIMLNFVNTAPMFTIASAIWGMGFGTFNPTMALKIIGSVPKSATTLALAILTCAMGIGQFISPMVFSLANKMAGLEGPRASWVIAAICFTAAFIIALVKVALSPPEAGRRWRAVRTWRNNKPKV